MLSCRWRVAWRPLLVAMHELCHSPGYTIRWSMAVEHDIELTFPTQTVTKPLLCEMARQTDVVFNIISANVSQHRGSC